MSEDIGRREIEVYGRQWVACAVIEGVGWDHEIPVRRDNWLLLESDGERRYIAPLPPDWETWSDDELRERVAHASHCRRRSPTC